MENELSSPLHISGYPSNEEIVAISSAYASLLQLAGDKSGDNPVDSGPFWSYSSDNRIELSSKNGHLAGQTQSWQRILRLGARL